MGNTLCKPVPEQFVEPTKKTDPLLTEEAIKILNIENDKKTESVTEIKATVIEQEPVITEPVISETEEPVISETIISETIISETEEPVIEDNLSLIQPHDESSSTSSKDDVPEPPKKKRGRKKKSDQ